LLAKSSSTTRQGRPHSDFANSVASPAESNGPSSESAQSKRSCSRTLWY
jgi:hypothetical protein